MTSIALLVPAFNEAQAMARTALVMREALDAGTLRCEIVHRRRGMLARESAVAKAPLLVAAVRARFCRRLASLRVSKKKFQQRVSCCLLAVLLVLLFLFLFLELFPLLLNYQMVFYQIFWLQIESMKTHLVGSLIGKQKMKKFI